MKFSRTCSIAMFLALLYCIGLIAVFYSTAPKEANDLQHPHLIYEETLFDNSNVHIIDIQVSESDWKQLKKDALSKECIDSTVLIDGEEICHVGVRTKGNSTLLLNAAKGWDLFSLVLEFDAFSESQRYHGLDQLALYNNMFDASCMKTYLCYEMMRSMDIPTPLCSFVALHLNGEYIGMYAASETFSESFALRNFGYDYGNLYKPEQFDIAAIMTGELQNTKLNLAAFSGESGGGFTIDSALSIPNDAVRLAYLGESLYEYEDIWRNTSFPIGVSDKKRVVNALKKLSEQDHPEEVLNMDMLARYFAVNTFVLNTDCYTTGMAHNYGLYEKDGILTMLPWDYDVALGNIGSEFGISDPTIFINQPIDTPVSGTTIEDRPVLHAMLNTPEGLTLYHTYLEQLLELWIETDAMNEEIDRIERMILPWIQKQTITVYSLEDHAQAVSSIKKFIKYRGESIHGQLNGTIPSTADTQSAAYEKLPDYSDYAPPASGIMTVLLPNTDAEEVSGAALLEVLPTANQNMHETVSLPALLGLIDLKQVLSMDFSSMTSKSSGENSTETEHSDISKEDLIAAVMPYPLILLRILLTVIALPAVLFSGIRLARRKKIRKGGIRHVV